MEFLTNTTFVAKKEYLDFFVQKYWFSPQDVLLRSVEANIIRACKFVHPVLDIGVGDGGISRFLFPGKLKIDVGIDIEESGLEKARNTGVYKKVMHVDAMRMPFKNASFGSVVSNSTFEHIEDDTKAVSEVGRILKKNGYFFLTVPSIYLPRTILSIEGEKGKQALDRFNTRVVHRHYNSLVVWEKMLAKNKLKIVFHRYYYPDETTVPWYMLMKISIFKIRNRELWSYLAHSKLRKFIPEKIVVYLLRKFVLEKPYAHGLGTKDGTGSMLFLVSQKI